MEKILNDKEISQALYLQIKREVEKNITYLINKREEDPHRGVFKRLVYQVKTGTPWDQVPTFEPWKRFTIVRIMYLIVPPHGEICFMFYMEDVNLYN